MKAASKIYEKTGITPIEVGMEALLTKSSKQSNNKRSYPSNNASKECNVIKAKTTRENP